MNIISGEKSSMLKTFADTLIELRRQHEDVITLTADVARSTETYRFGREFPESFINMGIAEQNMVAVASGLAKTGFKPYVAMFSSFATKRALDFIFMDVCFANLPVKIIGTHGGTSFAEAGSTHHALSDITILRSMPNMTVIVPADKYETAAAIKLSYNYDKPLYIRLNRGLDYDIHNSVPKDFEIGKAMTIKEGTDGYIIACGSSVAQGLMAAEKLGEEGINYGVINISTITPLDENAIKTAAKTGRIVTCEDGKNIGLGGAVAETLADGNINSKLIRLGINGLCGIGGHEDVMNYNNIGAAGIYEAAKRLYD